MTTIPSNLLDEAARVIAAETGRAFDAVRAMLPDDPALVDGHLHLVTFQEAWVDVSYAWQTRKECPAQRRCTEPEYRPLCGGRLSRTAYSIGD
jgi:hypothetical protein